MHSGQWRPPLPDFLKVNFDSAFDGNVAVSGVVIRDIHGIVIHAWSGHSIASSAFEAEALAALQAMKLAADLQLPKLVFEGDAVNVILALNGQDFCVEWQGQPAILQGVSGGVVVWKCRRGSPLHFFSFSIYYRNQFETRSPKQITLHLKTPMSPSNPYSFPSYLQRRIRSLAYALPMFELLSETSASVALPYPPL